MAKVKKFIWTSGPRKIKRIAWGYTRQVNGKQERRYEAAWTEQDAEKALAERILQGDTPPAPISSPPTSMTTSMPASMTFADAVTRYLTAKARKKTLADDRRYLMAFLAEFGPSTPLVEITAARLSAWRDAKLAAVSRHTGRMYSAAAVNRPVTILGTLLRLAHEEWEVLSTPPKRVRKAPEPQGRIRWLEPEEEARLLAACRRSRVTELAELVTVAMESGMRQGEQLGMEWPRVDLTRGVFKLEVTKSGKRREVPMRQAVYDLLAAKPEPREGRVWSHYPREPFEKALRVAQITDFTWHDLRHHFASWWMMRGGDLLALKDVLGHSSVVMTQRYAHLSPGHLREQMSRTDLSRGPANRARLDPAMSRDNDPETAVSPPSVSR